MFFETHCIYREWKKLKKKQGKQKQKQTIRGITSEGKWMERGSRDII